MAALTIRKAGRGFQTCGRGTTSTAQIPCPSLKNLCTARNPCRDGALTRVEVNGCLNLYRHGRYDAGQFEEPDIDHLGFPSNTHGLKKL